MLVYDHAVVRGGYRRLLELEGDFDVVAEHGDANAAYADLALEDGRAIDVLVLDISMPGRSGLDLLARVAGRWPALRTLVFTTHDNAALVAQALRAGAAGFVTKSSPPDDVVASLRRVAAGERGVLSPDVPGAPDAPAAALPRELLSAREFDVLRLLVERNTLDEVAARLHLSSKAVSNHPAMMRQKLGVSSAVELLRCAQSHRLFMP